MKKDYQRPVVESVNLDCEELMDVKSLPTESKDNVVVGSRHMGWTIDDERPWGEDEE